VRQGGLCHTRLRMPDHKVLAAVSWGIGGLFFEYSWGAGPELISIQNRKVKSVDTHEPVSLG
jgi:hypothetical protein